MKTLVGLILFAALAATVGCTTTDGDRYAADKPPPLAKNVPAAVPALATREPAATTIEPVKLTTSRTSITADEINESNLPDSVRRLEGELKTDGRTSARAGR
jgi:hypothetical protein